LKGAIGRKGKKRRGGEGGLARTSMTQNGFRRNPQKEKEKSNQTHFPRAAKGKEEKKKKGGTLTVCFFLLVIPSREKGKKEGGGSKTACSYLVGGAKDHNPIKRGEKRRKAGKRTTDLPSVSGRAKSAKKKEKEKKHGNTFLNRHREYKPKKGGGGGAIYSKKRELRA